MNPLAVIALIAAVGTGIAVFSRKRGAVSSWLRAYWAGQAQPPAEFIRRMQDGCTWIVDDGFVAALGPTELELSPDRGSPIRAGVNAVVSWVGSVPLRGQAIVLSSLDNDPEALIYVNFDPMVGLGQFVAADEIIGFCRASGDTSMTFRVVAEREPTPDSAAWARHRTIDPRAWLHAKGTHATATDRGWA